MAQHEILLSALAGRRSQAGDCGAFPHHPADAPELQRKGQGTLRTRCEAATPESSYTGQEEGVSQQWRMAHNPINGRSDSTLVYLQALNFPKDRGAAVAHE